MDTIKQYCKGYQSNIVLERFTEGFQTCDSCRAKQSRRSYNNWSSPVHIFTICLASSKGRSWVGVGVESSSQVSSSSRLAQSPTPVFVSGCFQTRVVKTGGRISGRGHRSGTPHAPGRLRTDG